MIDRKIQIEIVLTNVQRKDKKILIQKKIENYL